MHLSIASIIDSRVKGIGNSIKLNQHLLYHACLGISHLKGVKQSKGQEESQEEKKLEARNGEYNTPVGILRYWKTHRKTRDMIYIQKIRVIIE